MLIPTVGELKKAAKLVEEYGRHIVSFTCRETERGAEKVEFDAEHMRSGSYHRSWWRLTWFRPKSHFIPGHRWEFFQ
jgi:hypothetical protein